MGRRARQVAAVEKNDEQSIAGLGAIGLQKGQQARLVVGIAQIDTRHDTDEIVTVDDVGHLDFSALTTWKLENQVEAVSSVCYDVSEVNHNL